MLTIIDHFWAIRLCSCRTWGGTGRHYLIHLWESEQQREIKWILIRTVWDVRCLHLNQSKESSGKSTPCFQLAYAFYSGGGILEAFFQSLLPSLVHPNNLQKIHKSGWICSDWNFIPQSLNTDNWYASLGRYLIARVSSEFFLGTSKDFSIPPEAQGLAVPVWELWSSQCQWQSTPEMGDKNEEPGMKCQRILLCA